MDEPKAPVKRGSFIVFEGIDRSGKTTQSQRLTEILQNQGIPAVYMRFPDRTTPIGKMIHSYLQSTTHLNDQTIHLLFSANRWEAKETILKHLSEGKTVVADRYAYSGAAFSSAKGLDLEWCKTCDRGLPKPDFVFYLNISAERASERNEFGSERYDNPDFQSIVNLKFKPLAEFNWSIVDATMDPDEITRQIKNLIIDHFQARDTRVVAPIQNDLWLDK